MKKELDEFVEKQLERFPEQDVLIHYERGDFKITHGFFTWNGHNHSLTTIGELRRDGWEKSDIKELRDDAKRFTVIEHSFGKFEVKDE
jgi:hypothetical protein